jgi:hypothetical protein
MNLIKYSGLLILFCGAFLEAGAQKDWTLKTQEDGISIYMKEFPDSKFKAIRVICQVNTTLSQMVAVIMDVNTGADWVYSVKSSRLLKQVSPSELYYYCEVALPWPFSNRDFIAHLIVTQDTLSKVVTIHGPTVTNYIPEKSGIVRVASSEGLWILTPKPNHTVRLDYTLRTDPGGSVPAWLVNLFATKGPMETFKKLKAQLAKPAYANIHLPYVKE